MKAFSLLVAVAGLALVGCDRSPTEEKVAETVLQPAGENKTIPWPPETENMIVNPLETVTDDVMAYRFERGDSTYLLAWSHPRTYYVELYKASGGEWTSIYESATMGKPYLRQTNDRLQLFLVQPFFQIGEEEPRAGHDYYEILTVDSGGVSAETVELPTMPE